MATMRKNQQGHWAISIQSLGLNTTFSTRTSKKADANRVRREIESRVDKVKVNGSHPFHDWTKDEQKEWIKTGRQPASLVAPVRLKEAVSKYLVHKQNEGKATTTVNSYELHLEAAKDYFGDIALRDLNSRKLQDWSDFLSKQVNVEGKNRGKKPKPVTINKKLNQLKTVVKWFYGLGEPNLHPEAFNAVTVSVKQAAETDQLESWVDFETRCKELATFRIDPASENAFGQIIYSSKQLDEHLEDLEKKLFNDGTVATIRLYCAIRIACCTGARRSELARVRRQDLILDDEMPMVTLTKMKGRKQEAYLRQKMPLPVSVVPYLRRLLKVLPEEQQSLFSCNDIHLTQSGFDESRVSHKACYLTKQVNKHLKGTKWEHAAGWHIYRHTLASQLLLNGHTQVEVMNFIGWCKEEMARKYQHTTHERKAAMINRIFK